MDSLLQTDEDEDRSASRLMRQALSFLMHTILALGAWLALMLLGYALNPQDVSQLVILLLSLAVPLIGS
jgi:hypothetical protein